MNKIEQYFDINMVLMTTFSALESVREEKGIELVYDIDATIPKELKGDKNSVTHLLTQLLLFVFQNTDDKEIILRLRAPENFLYEEVITFEIDNTDLSKYKAESFFNVRLKPVLERLDGMPEFDDETGKISVSLPFKLKDLGNRRYYRLPDIGMLGKKVLLISKSRIIAESLRKMFQYFLYEVDAGAEEYQRRGSNLAYYDIFILEDTLLTEGIEELVVKVKETYDLKFVVLEDAAHSERLIKPYISAYLVKPVMQESIYELIIALYEKDIKERKIKKEVGKPIINMEKYIMDAFEKSEEAYADKEKEKSLTPAQKEAEKLLKDIEEEEKKFPILNIPQGRSRSRKLGIEYIDNLQGFIESFGKSDLYFHDMVKNKLVWKIKELVIDLEQRSHSIGAERMEKLAEKISMLFVHDNLDFLPVYTGKYHLELKKLIAEIKKYLKKKQIDDNLT